MFRCFCALTVCFASGLGQCAVATEPLLQAGDTLAIVGGTFVERMQQFGEVEAELQCRRPAMELRVRNVGWSGDVVKGTARKAFDGPADGYARLLRDIDIAKPTAVLIAYGISEASEGVELTDKFGEDLKKLIADVQAAEQKGARRVFLLTPPEMPGYRVDGYSSRIKHCQDEIRRVGVEAGLPVINLAWQPSPAQINDSGLLPNAAGYQAIANELADSLVGGKPCASDLADLKVKIGEKNQLFFHRYRPQNETYLLLFRKHEQGNNAAELPMFDPLVKVADQAIWDAANH